MEYILYKHDYTNHMTVWFQIKRLKECEKMLVAIELAGWLNESNLALQAVVQCYGLVAPLIFYKIPSIPVFQVSFYLSSNIQF